MMKKHVLRSFPPSFLTALLLASLTCLASGVAAQPAKPAAAPPEVSEALPHPWVIPSPHGAESYFTNLKPGAVVESPFVVQFGLSGRGLVPAGKEAGKAGHHHLLINQALPLDFSKPLPFTEKYVHFGKGQMETVVNLPPGDYELRLLLADQAHIPYFVYSKPLKLTVKKQNKAVTPASLLGAPSVQLLSPADGTALRPPFRVQFHASGYNISSAAPKLADTSHFRLTMERSGQKPEVMNFTGGQTEAWMNPPAGDYKLQLELLGNVDGAVTGKAKPVAVTVQAK